MFIYHLFSIYDINNGTKYSSQPIINFLGYVRLLYIILAGVSLYLATNSKKNQSMSKFLKKRCLRSYNIAIYAIILTLITFFLYPNIMIRFGVLHFIALGTLIIAPIAYINSKYITLIFFIISIILAYRRNFIPSISKSFDVILGCGKRSPYSAMDWFPLLKFIPYLLFGLLIAQIFKFNNKNDDKNDDKNEYENEDKNKYKNDYENEDKNKYKYKNKDKKYEKTILHCMTKSLEWMGKKSLELYTAHVIILLLIFYNFKNSNMFNF